MTKTVVDLINFLAFEYKLKRYQNDMRQKSAHKKWLKIKQQTKI